MTTIIAGEVNDNDHFDDFVDDLCLSLGTDKFVRSHVQSEN